MISSMQPPLASVKAYLEAASSLHSIFSLSTKMSLGGETHTWIEQDLAPSRGMAVGNAVHKNLILLGNLLRDPVETADGSSHEAQD